MKEKTLGVILIGQSPRPDIVAELRTVLGTELRIDVRGALDGVPRSEIETLTPSGSEDTLFTRLPGGEPVIISKKEVTKRTQPHIDDLAHQGIDVILMFCTGSFKGLNARGLMVFPSTILTGAAAALLPKGTLGIFTPLPAQAEQVRSKWIQGQWDVVVEPLLPIASPPELESAAKRMGHHRPDLIVMDCMGYTSLMKTRVREITGIRALLAVSTAARVVQELLD